MSTILTNGETIYGNKGIALKDPFKTPLDPSQLNYRKVGPTPSKGFTLNQGLTAGLQGLTAGMQNYNAVNSDMINNNINQASGLQVGAVSTSDLINQFNNQQLLDENVTMEDVGWDWKEQLGNIGSAALSGAATGSWVGAAIGGGAALLGSTIGGFKASREAKEASKRAKATNILTNQKYVNEASDLFDQSFNSLIHNYAAYGGNLFNNGGNMMDFTTINNGGTHEQNPYGGVPIGVDREGTPNLVEEGEVIYNDYVYSNRLKPSKKYKTKYKIDDSRTYADIAKEIQKNFEENPNDPITKKGVESRMEELKQDHEITRMRKNKKTQKESNTFDLGGFAKWAPLSNDILSLGLTLADKYDDSYSKRLQNIKPVAPIEAEVPDYTFYKPSLIDNNYVLNNLKSAHASGMNYITSPAERILRDHRFITNVGEVMLKNQDYNNRLINEATAANNAIKSEKAQILNTVNAQNAEIAKYNKELELQKLISEYNRSDTYENNKAAAISSGFTNLSNNIHNQFYKEPFAAMQALNEYIGSGRVMTPQMLEYFNFISPEIGLLAKNYMEKYPSGIEENASIFKTKKNGKEENSGKYGGKLNKNKKGFTY